MDGRERALRRASELAFRISVSNWSTTEADIDRTADALLRAAAR